VARGAIFTQHRNMALHSPDYTPAEVPGLEGVIPAVKVRPVNVAGLIHDTVNQGSSQSTNMTLERTISSAQDGVLSGIMFSPRLEIVALFKPGLQRFWPVTRTRNVSVGAYRKDMPLEQICCQRGPMRRFREFRPFQNTTSCHACPSWIVHGDTAPGSHRNPILPSTQICVMEIDSRWYGSSSGLGVTESGCLVCKLETASVRAMRGRTSERAAVGPVGSLSHSVYAMLGNP